ncbi:hypothetical protein ACFY7H_11115 [Streptomyces sp. NPDC012794]|uniref:hypothetical protein n=1 Tax=Streptomyces sp. NPDC012794 TaxID=3364850 RepID=UPI0036BA0668
MTRHTGTAISAFGVLACSVLLVGAVHDYRTGASPLWIAAGALLFLGAVCTLVRDVRRSRASA